MRNTCTNCGRLFAVLRGCVYVLPSQGLTLPQDDAQVDIFDAVLIFKGYEDLVRQHRPVTEDALNDPVRRLGKPTRVSVYAPFSFRQIAEFVLLLPVNIIPYVGVPMFLLLTGYRAGPFQHWRYFQLLGYDSKKRGVAIKRRRWQYTWSVICMC
jgi:hypothetical protein